MAVIILNSGSSPITKETAKGVGYIVQEHKSYKKEFYNCTEENYDREFQRVWKNRNAKREDSRTFYHIKQTFAPEDNITPETAFEIGKKLAEDYAELGYQVVISTHTDSNHIHNHIIFNAINRITFDAYRDNKSNFKNLQKRNDDLLREYGLLTRAELKERNRKERNQKKSEQELQKKSVQLDKEIIINAINTTLSGSNVSSIFGFIKEINKLGIKSYFRGNTITFSINDKKYRGSSISQEYSLEAIKRKIHREYTDKDVIKNLLVDHKSEFKNIEDLKDFCATKQIDVFEKEDDLIFKFGNKKDQISLSSIFGLKLDCFNNKLQMASTEKVLKKDILDTLKKESFESVEAFINHLKEKEYLKDVKIIGNTIIFDTKKGSLDIKSLGYGSDRKNRFSLENIDVKLFIKRIGDRMKMAVKREEIKNMADLSSFCKKNDIILSADNGKMTILYQGRDINLKRFIDLKEELLKKTRAAFFSKLYRVKSYEDLKQIGVETSDGVNHYYQDLDLKTIVIYNRCLDLSGIKYLIQHNLYKNILNASSSYEEFDKKMRSENPEYEYNPEIVRIKLQEKKIEQDYKEIIRGKTTDREIFRDLTDAGYDIEKDSMYYHIFRQDDPNIVFSIQCSSLEKTVKENSIIRELFIKLKQSISIQDFLSSGERKVVFDGEKLYIDGVSIFHLNFRNDRKEDIFSKSNIEERMRENYDYIHQTTTSIKYQFKEEYLSALRRASSLEEFKSKLLLSERFSYHFSGGDIIFTDKVTGKTFNADHYNFKVKFYSLDTANNFIEERNRRFTEVMDKRLFFGRFVRMINSREYRQARNRGVTFEEMKYLRIKREDEERQRR